MMRGTGKLFGLALGAVAMAAAPSFTARQAAAQTVQLDVEQMRLAAELNLRNGDMGRALAFADALLQRDPQDVTALLIRSHALRATGEAGKAQDAARTAWQLAPSDNLKYSSAMLMAQALSSDGKRTRSQLWLRRAAQVAPTEEQQARAAQDFRYVQRNNPWQTQLAFTLAPNSNINNGSARATSALLWQIFNPFNQDGTGQVVLGAASKALSGLEMGVDVQTRYRFHQTERTAHDLRLGLSYRSYRLSGSARDALALDDAERVARGERPQDITGSDFAYGTVQLGYGYKRLRSDQRGEFSLTADLGQSFYAGARYNSYLRGTVGQSYYANETTKFDFGLSAETRHAQRGIAQDTLSLSAGMSRKLASGDGLYLGAAVSTVASDTARAEYDEVRLRAGYMLGRELMGTALQFGMSTSFRDYDISPHDPSGRRETQLTADITATFRQINYMGFKPVVSLTASTTDSNIGLYDVKRTGLSIGIASAF